MKKYKKTDLITGIVLMILSAGYVIASFSIPVREGVPSPRMVPQCVGSLIFLLAALLVYNQVKEIVRNPHAGSEEKAIAETEEEIKPNYLRVALTLLFLMIYCLCFETLGFIISSFALMCAEMYLLAGPEWRSKKRIILMVVISFIASAGVYCVFRYGLNVVLPQGILKGLL